MSILKNKKKSKQFECTFSLFGYVVILPFCPSLVSTLAAKKGIHQWAKDVVTSQQTYNNSIA